MSSKKINKGDFAEEALRIYFQEQGLYAVRGIKLKYEKQDITDIDLWLYSKSSSLSRDILNVDIKNKKRSKALERILWTKGLQGVLGTSSSIVATADSKKTTKDFAAKNNVILLDGKFLGRIKENYSLPENRLTEEEFFNELDKCTVIKGRKWSIFYEESKSNLLRSLTFNGINSSFHNIKEILTVLISGKFKDLTLLRLCYVEISYLLLKFDFIAKDLVTEDQRDREKIIEDGLSFGDNGAQRSREIVDFSLSLIGSVDMELANSFRKEFDSQVISDETHNLAVLFARSKLMKQLYQYAILFEKCAYAKEVILPHSLEPDMKSMLGVLCDFFKFDRRDVIVEKKEKVEGVLYKELDLFDK